MISMEKLKALHILKVKSGQHQIGRGELRAETISEHLLNQLSDTESQSLV